MDPVTPRAQPQPVAPPRLQVRRRTFVGRTAALGALAWTAPSVLSTSPVAAAAGSCTGGTTICEFVTGLEGWTIDNTFGPGARGYWTHNTEASRDGGSLHYGQGTSGTYRRGNARTSGSVTSPQFAIPSSGPNRVAFTVWREVETWSNDNYDVLRLSILGTTNQVLWSAGSDGGTGGVFETHNVALPASFNGDDVSFRFDFDTVDGLYNNFEGIYIGRFYVTACDIALAPSSGPSPQGGPGNNFSPPGQSGGGGGEATSRRTTSIRVAETPPGSDVRRRGGRS